MIRPDKNGYYIIDSKDKLEQWYALTKQDKPQVVKVKPKTKKKKSAKTKSEKTLSKFFG
jgi:hypothetical protein